MAADGQYATKRELTLCDPNVRGGMTICFSEGKCQSCDFAKKYEHPEEVRA